MSAMRRQLMGRAIVCAGLLSMVAAAGPTGIKPVGADGRPLNLGFEDGTFTFRLTGFEPESRYSWRAVGVAYGVSGAKVDSDGTTDHATGLLPPQLKRVSVPILRTNCCDTSAAM